MEGLSGWRSSIIVFFMLVCFVSTSVLNIWWLAYIGLGLGLWACMVEYYILFITKE